jgi:uncharacterized repeat protein (TIGR01451 family)
VDPLSEKWSEGARVIEEKEKALKKQQRRLKWRRVVLTTMTMLITTMVVCVVAINGLIYLKPKPDEVASVEHLTLAATPGKPSDTTILNKSDDGGHARTLSADLVLANSDSPDQVTPGGELAYTIIITNNGPDTAQSVRVTDNLPSTVTFVKCMANKGGVCAGAGNKRAIFFASLTGGVIATITLHTTASNSLTQGATINNTASVTSETSDPKSGNNSDTETTTVHITPTVCSEDDQKNERKSIIESLRPLLQRVVDSELQEIKSSLLGTEGVQFNSSQIHYDFKFREACTVSSISAKYELQVSARTIRTRPIPKEKKFTCEKTLKTWRCQLI